jgi:hypothetical protein
MDALDSVGRQTLIEEALGRVRDVILSARKYSDLRHILAGINEELNALEIETTDISLQLASEKIDVYLQVNFARNESFIHERVMADHPWVEQAMRTNSSAVFFPEDCPTHRHWKFGFNWVAEIPVPGLGTMGVTSKTMASADEEHIKVFEQFAPLVSLAYRRVEDFEALRKQQEAEHLFAQKLAALHAITLEIGLEKSLDDVCRKAIDLGREKLQFERLALFLVQPGAPDFLAGTFGTDEHGQTQDESGNGFQLPENERWQKLKSGEALFILRHEQLQSATCPSTDNRQYSHLFLARSTTAVRKESLMSLNCSPRCRG